MDVFFFSLSLTIIISCCYSHRARHQMAARPAVLLLTTKEQANLLCRNSFPLLPTVIFLKEEEYGQNRERERKYSAHTHTGALYNPVWTRGCSTPENRNLGRFWFFLSFFFHSLLTAVCSGARSRMRKIKHIKSESDFVCSRDSFLFFSNSRRTNKTRHLI